MPSTRPRPNRSEFGGLDISAAVPERKRRTSALEFEERIIDIAVLILIACIAYAVIQ